MISDARLIFWGSSGYLSPPHRLSRCHRSCHNSNFTAIGASEGPDQVQHSSLQSRRRGVIRTFRYSMIPTTRQCLYPLIFNESSRKRPWACWQFSSRKYRNRIGFSYIYSIRLQYREDILQASLFKKFIYLLSFMVLSLVCIRNQYFWLGICNSIVTTAWRHSQTIRSMSCISG